jgi:hypothetical protein
MSNKIIYNGSIAKVSSLLLMALLFITTGTPSNALAQPPYSADLVQGGNKWFLDAYDDTDPDHALINTVGLCFQYAGTQGSHQQYTWYSDTFRGWQGTASQEGDQIFIYGVYADGKGQDAIQLKIIIDTPRSGSVGHWQEWRENGSYGETIGFANARMIRDIENGCTMTAKEALDSGFFFPFFPYPTTNNNPMTYKP